MGGTILVSHEGAKQFLDKCILAGIELNSKLVSIGSFELQDKMENLERMKVFHYVSWSLKFFLGRMKFIRAAMEVRELNKDILENLFRGLIEIYCRVLFVINNSDKEALKRIVWKEIYFAALVDTVFYKHKPTKIILEEDYKLLRKAGIETPCFGIVKACVRHRLQGTEKSFSDCLYKQYVGLAKELSFPSVTECLNKYLVEDEAPRVTRFWLKRQYSLLSEQVHGNFLMELADKSLEEDFIILSFSILLFLRFLKCVALKARSEAEISKLIDEFLVFSPEYLKLWSYSRLSN